MVQVPYFYILLLVRQQHVDKHTCSDVAIPIFFVSRVTGLNKVSIWFSL